MKAQISSPTALAALLLATPAGAQTFNWSDQSDGALNITMDTEYVLPDDGVINATTVTVDSGATLTFRRNARNTPVVLLASGDIRVDGTIDVSGSENVGAVGGLGGPGGFDGGDAGVGTNPPGNGRGPGGGVPPTTGSCRGYGGYGGHTVQTRSDHGRIYGTQLLIPLVGGSGGSGASAALGYGGGGGGGAIILASRARIQIDGAVTSRGARSNDRYGCGEGSGGAIRLLSPVVTGSGNVDVRPFRFGVPGRIRVDTLDPRAAQTLTFRGTSSALTISSFMELEPMNVPSLRITSVAGQTIMPSMPSQVLLPGTASPSQTVVVQADNFTGMETLEVVVTPVNGAASTFTQSFSGGASTSVNVSVTLPPNVLCHIDAYVL